MGGGQRGFGGAGVLEVVEDWQSDTCQKKSKTGSKTPKPEIDLVKARLKAAEAHYKEWSKKMGTP